MHVLSVLLSVCSSKVNLHNINIFHLKCQLAVPHLYDHFKCEDSSENVVKISQNLQHEKEKVMSLRKTKLSHNTQHAAHNPTLDSDKLVASLVTGGFRLFTFNKKYRKTSMDDTQSDCSQISTLGASHSFLSCSRFNCTLIISNQEISESFKDDTRRSHATLIFQLFNFHHHQRGSRAPLIIQITT